MQYLILIPQHLTKNAIPNTHLIFNTHYLKPIAIEYQQYHINNLIPYIIPNTEYLVRNVNLYLIHTSRVITMCPIHNTSVKVMRTA